MMEKLLTVSEAAERLALKRSTLYSWVFERRIRFVRLGRRAIRIMASDVEKFIQDSVREPEETRVDV